MRFTISQLYFGKELYMFQTDLHSIIRTLSTVFTTIAFVILVMLTLLARSGSILTLLADSQQN